MNYFPLHIGDFSTDTAPFSAEEVGVYMRLLFLYYKAEGPLPSNVEDLEFNTISRTPGEKKALRHVLRRCFTLDDQNNVYVQKRCEEVIAEYRAQHLQSRYANLCRHWDKANKGVEKPCYDDFAKNPDSYFDDDTGRVRKVTARKPPALQLTSDPPPTLTPPESPPISSNQEPGTNGSPVVPKGTKEEPTPESLAEAIYALYPRKEAKPKAIEAIIKAMAKTGIMELELQSKVRIYAAHIQRRLKQDKTFLPKHVPMPATWFNQHRFMDDPATWEALASTPQNSPEKKEGGGAPPTVDNPCPAQFEEACMDLYGAVPGPWALLGIAEQADIRAWCEKKKGGAAE